MAFDDDDWYSKDYVNYMSKLLMSSSRLIAGSSKIYNYSIAGIIFYLFWLYIFISENNYYLFF